MVGSAETAKPFILVPKNVYQNLLNQVETSKEQQTPLTTETPGNVVNQSSAKPVETSTTSSYQAIKDRILDELKNTKGFTQNTAGGGGGGGKLWSSAIQIIDILLSSERLGVQFSDLRFTVNGQPIDKTLTAPQFVYALLRYNKKIPRQVYGEIISAIDKGTVSTKLAHVVKNRQVQEVLQNIYAPTNTALVGAGSQSTTASTAGKINATKTNTGTKQKRTKTKRSNKQHQKQNPIWISFRE